MKKIMFFLIIAIIALTGCSGSRTKLYVFNWSYYIPDSVLRDFEKKFNAEIIYDVFSSNEEMYTKLKAGGSGYDIVFPSGDYTSIMIKENMLEKIDKSKVPNFKYLDSGVLAKIRYDPENVYSVPYVMGAAGITVNTKYVKNYVKDYSIFERKDLKGRMTLLDDMREVLGSALRTLGYSCNSTNYNELLKAKALVLKWKDNILKFDAESFGKGFANGEYWVVQGYPENVFSELDDEAKKNADFFIPQKGGTMYIDSMVILKDAKNKDLAYKFINYIQSPETYAVIADFFRLPSINTEARKLIKEKPNYSLEDLSYCEIKEDIGAELELYNKIWQEIRLEN